VAPQAFEAHHAGVNYALKIINKKKLVSHNAAVRTRSLLSEKQALEELNHPFVLALRSTYQDRNNLFLLVDLALGGELFRVMEEFDRLLEPAARFYAGSLCLALQHIHQVP
jgi:serine/threonine protein kinase